MIMNLNVSQEAHSMGLITAVLQSEHAPKLFAGKQTHDAGLRLAGQLVRYTESDDLIGQIVGAALPPDYRSDALVKLPEQIKSARAKGFDAAGREPSVAEIAVCIIKNAGVTLFRDTRDRPFMAVAAPGGGRLNYELGSKQAKAVIDRLHYMACGRALSSATRKEVINALQAEALVEGEKHEVFLRIGGGGGAVYIDLGHVDGIIVEITGDGWRTTHDLRSSLSDDQASALCRCPSKVGRSCPCARCWASTRRIFASSSR
jgi:hypothetical protein